MAQWLWRRSWKCEKFTDGQTDDRQHVLRKAHLSFQLRWAKKLIINIGLKQLGLHKFEITCVNEHIQWNFFLVKYKLISCKVLDWTDAIICELKIIIHLQNWRFILMFSKTPLIRLCYLINFMLYILIINLYFSCYYNMEIIDTWGKYPLGYVHVILFKILVEMSMTH